MLQAAPVNSVLNTDKIWTMWKDIADMVRKACSCISNYSKKIEESAHNFRLAGMGLEGYLVVKSMIVLCRSILRPRSRVCHFATEF